MSGLLFVTTASHNRSMLAERALPADLDSRIRALADAWADDPDIAIYLSLWFTGGIAPRTPFGRGHRHRPPRRAG